MTKKTSHLTITDADGVHIVEFADRKILEELSISEIGEELSTLIDELSDIRLLLSFRQVEHLSSAALGMLIKLHHEIRDKGGRLKLSDISPPIFEVFKITRLNKLFSIYDTRDEALRSF